MLASLLKNDVAFQSENVFCFDNESFRYLVDLQNGIDFSDLEKSEYEKSWSTSVTQLNHFINHIQTNLTAYCMNDNLQSAKHAQREIVRMIRPILETMRNILRNRVIHTMSQSNGSFELHPKAVSHPSSICNLCMPYPLKVDKFWVAQNILHEIGNTCNFCQCSLDQHHPIDYVLEYEFLNKTSTDDQTEMNDLLHRLCEASVDFAYFLTNSEISSKTDPFFLGLVQMMIEEKYLCNNQKPNDFNLKLVDYLRELQEEHDDLMKSIMDNQKESELSDIYQLINTIREYPMVREQMAAIKEGQKMIWKQYEVEMLENSNNTFSVSTRL
jgi:hypothetical protein